VTAYPYDRTYEPPAPVVPLRVSPPDGAGTGVLLPALIDSGSDLTVIPAEVTLQLNLPETDHVTVRAAGSVMGPASVCAAHIELDGVTEIVEVLALGDETLVGRNLLASLVVTLHGPAEEVTIARP
jgi:predicted aspartyl protease